MYVKIKSKIDDELFDDVVILRVLRIETTFVIQLILGPVTPPELVSAACDAALNDFISRSIQ